MSNPENNKSTKPAASGPAEHVSLAYLIYAVCYLLGARIIRYCRRSRRVLRKTCLHLKWKIRSAYLDIREQRAAASITQKSWKYEWKVAFDRTFQALQEWKRRRQQSGKLHPLAFLKAIAPAAKMMTRAVNYLLPIAAMVVLTLTVQHFGTLRYGLRVEYNGEHIGYILSESAFTEAEAKVRERIVNEAYLPPEDSVPIYSLEVVQDDQISGEDILINNIIRASGNEIAEGAGLYVDDEFIGAVSDGDELLLSLKSRRDGTYQPGVPVSELQPAEEETTQPEETTEPEEATEPAETTPPEETTEPEESTEEPQSSPAQTHVIQEGDSLWDIAMEYGVSVETLTELNPDVSQTMLVGEELIISEGSSDSSSTQQTEEETTVEEPAAETTSQEDQPAAEDTEESSSTSSGQRQTYTIQEGDSLWDIAIEFDVSVETLTDLNPEVSRTMLVGEELIISDGSAPAEESSDDTAGEQSSEEEQPTEEQSSGEDTTQTEEDTTQTEETATTIPEDAVVTFVQSIRVEEGLYPVSSIESLDAINAKLDTVVEGEQTYTIQEGDSPSLVADKVGIPTQTLIDLNPEVTQTMLVGDTLIISHEQPFLQTQMVRTVTEEREIPYTTETEVDHNKESTYEEVVQEGQNGLEEVVSQITYINGYETERTVLSETVIVEPVNAQIVVGSLTSTQYNFSGSGTPSTESNVGGYIWPVNGGYISCPIWGYYNHTGTDIAADAGTTIWAAKAGTVIYAGWSNGYGYNILISHPDGTRTRYAHCSELAAYVGQQVSQGQVIGYVGRTGNATGNHCHFEIISSSGAFLDARDYIGYSY